MTLREAFEEIEKRIPAATPLTAALREFVKFYASTSIEGCRCVSPKRPQCTVYRLL